MGLWYLFGVTGTFDSDWQPPKIANEPGLIDAVTFARTRLLFEPDDKQMEVLQSTAKRGILNCSRQWGKSTVTAAKLFIGCLWCRSL